ncbi:MAG: SUMF1/EgtB/PvdO family nonheme iron enzyme [Anaerolineales bacterium]|nr:SUMF1/EgtB/PvdO family nonheme iron enzyme [Anaerolineales bacterium]
MGDENILAKYHNENYIYEYLFPYPLADLYRRYRVSREPYDKLGFLLSASEASLKFLVAVSFGLTNTNNEKLIQDLSRVKLNSPSFGTWEKLLEIVVSNVEKSSETNELTSLIIQCLKNNEGKQSEYIKSVKKLIEWRNDYVHGGTITSLTAKNILEEAEPVFRNAFRSLSFLANYPFVICEEVRFIRNPSCFEAVIRLAQGCNPTFPYEIWRLDKPIDPQVTLLMSPNLSTAYSLNPILIILPDEKMDAPRCYFYSHKNGHVYWQSYEFHKDNIKQGPSELEEEMVSLINGSIKISQTLLEFHDNNKPPWLKSLSKSSKSLFNFTPPAGYELLGVIGQGRYGIVYKVFHTGLKEVRALKIILPEISQDPRLRKRFEIEAQVLAKLRGKSAGIDLYEYGETNEGFPYIILQLAEEGSLQEYMERWGQADWNLVLGIGIKCFTALKAVHETGILHRDIKLSNILVSGDRYLLCDFGVSKFIDSNQSLTLMGDAIGTIGYMPPEQRDGTSDARSDLYSLGVCLVHLLAGKPLPDHRKWLYQSYKGNLDFRNALLSLLEPIPENRPPSASAILERFRIINKEYIETENNQEIDTKITPPKNTAITDNALLPELSNDNPQPRYWRSSDGTVFRQIPSGEYLMGGTKYPDERPVHKVRFDKPFFMATTLVTNSMFRRFCAETKYRGSGDNFLLHFMNEKTFNKSWREATAPVVFVSWIDVKEYILWRSEQDDLDYRLPSEAEWEYACRADSRTVYPWGNTFDMNMLNTGKRHGHPTPVGTFPPNSWGLFDMLGNVWEWCEDIFDVLPNEESLFYRYCSELPFGSCVNPVNSGPDAMFSKRVRKGLRAGRGGSWFSDNHNCRPANRRGRP